ncbi:MAG: type II toxin-antitoxin system RelE/ParE family toxin [Deltaproteobacteria bacterium]|nr:type II toxin-antitoxin system RelE/ParE family toxin [Deltaproteobacteria bacterium]
MRHVAKVGLEASRHLRGEIWEVRVQGENRIFRVLFSPEGRFGQVLLALEAFTKKTQKTPPATIALAEKRLSDWRRRGAAARRGG